MRVVVAGATGVVGRHVVDEARRRGHEVVPLARALGVDVLAGVGLDAALERADVVVDVLNASTTSARASTAFFSTTTRAMLAAERSAGVAHHVALSVVGIDRVDAGYYAGKVVQEHAVASGDVPWTVLRATQLHDFVPLVLAQTPPGPVALVPSARICPVDAAEVGAALVDAVEAGPSGRVRDLAGPHQEDLVDLVRRHLRARRSRRHVVRVTLPGRSFRAMRDGSLLPGPDARRGQVGFDAWLMRAVG